MKPAPRTKIPSSQIEGKNLSLGDLIVSTYSACGEQRAAKILQLAIESNLVRFKRIL